MYRNIELCRNAETLWGKLREGRWDWLGVHRNGQFVLGSPRRSGVISDDAAAQVVSAEYPADVHGVRVVTDPRLEDLRDESWYASAEEACAEFDRRLEDLRSREGPLITKLSLIVDRTVARDEYVVLAPSTYDWRPPATS